MAHTTSQQSDKNNNVAYNKEIIEDNIGNDIIQDDGEEYNLDVYGEFVPSFQAWQTPESQKNRVKEILRGME